MIAPLLLAAVLWLWDPVTTSCAGGPEQIDHYEMQQSTARSVDAWCDTGDGLFWCGGYLFDDWMPVATTPDVTPELEYEPPVPIPGAVVYNRVVAVDTAGNRSDDACQ